MHTHWVHADRSHTRTHTHTHTHTRLYSYKGVREGNGTEFKTTITIKKEESKGEAAEEYALDVALAMARYLGGGVGGGEGSVADTVELVKEAFEAVRTCPSWSHQVIAF